MAASLRLAMVKRGASVDEIRAAGLLPPRIDHAPTTRKTQAPTPELTAQRADVRSALSGLGYGAGEIAAAMRDLTETGDTADQLRAALRAIRETTT